MGQPSIYHATVALSFQIEICNLDRTKSSILATSLYKKVIFTKNWVTRSCRACSSWNILMAIIIFYLKLTIIQSALKQASSELLPSYDFVTALTIIQLIPNSWRMTHPATWKVAMETSKEFMNHTDTIFAHYSF